MLKLKLRLFNLFFFCIFFFLFLFLLPSSALAQTSQTHKTIYNAEYFPQANGNSKVNLQIKIINLKPDVYVKELTLSFSSFFSIEGVSAKDDKGEIKPNIKKDDRNIQMILSFSDPSYGQNSENNFYVNFLQKNLFKTAGNVWEVILPTISKRDNIAFNMTVNLPENINKKLSISKPKPSNISGNKIYWNDIQTKTVYAVFGNVQYYDLDLVYDLKNDSSNNVYYDIPFPPETLYQKIFVTSLNPKPNKVYLDEDGNYLGRYVLKLRETKRVNFKGAAAVYVHPQTDLLDYFQKNFLSQKNYLLTQQKFWSIGEKREKKEIKELKTAGDIYKYTVDKLSYDYGRAAKNLERLGAEKVLNEPQKAVCMEFTDLFIALSREKGIYSREINGYGFSNDPNLRPLSLLTDVLHSWPEYYDEKNKIWMPVDPTWENTSGIDYFSAFDLNHIVLAIHGKDQNYPPAVGSYKFDDKSQNINIKTVPDLPQEIIEVEFDSEFKTEINDRNLYQGKIRLKNTGNVFIKNAVFKLISPSLNIAPSKVYIDLLAPYQTFESIIKYSAKLKNQEKQDVITFLFNDKTVQTKSIQIVSFYKDILFKSLTGLIVLSLLFIVYLLVRGKKS